MVLPLSITSSAQVVYRMMGVSEITFKAMVIDVMFTGKVEDTSLTHYDFTYIRTMKENKKGFFL